MTLWSDFTADCRSCVQGPVNIQYLMSVCSDNSLSCSVQCLENLPGLSQWASKRAYCDAVKAHVLIQTTKLPLILLWSTLCLFIID